MRRVVVAISLLLGCSPAWAAIALDVTSESAVGSNQTAVSWAHTNTGSNMVLVVAVYTFDTVAGDRDVTGVTYNSDPMTLILEQDAEGDGNSNYRASLWYLLAPDTGSGYTIAATLGGTCTKSMGSAISLTGVSQTGQPTDSDQNFGNGTSSSVTLTMVDNAWVINVANVAGSTTDITESDVTNFFEACGDIGTGCVGALYSGPLTPAGDYARGWSWASARDFISIGATFSPVAEAATRRLWIVD